MRKWGIVISAFYALILLALIVPGAIFLSLYKFEGWGKFLETVNEAYGDWMLWLLIAAILASQALLLFLSVDTSHKRLKPQAHILVSCVAAAVLTALLTSGIVWSLDSPFAERIFGNLSSTRKRIFCFFGARFGCSGPSFSISISATPQTR